jgi:hypothetical protein
MIATPQQDGYLHEHLWGLLATGRRDGSPQLSMVAYDWDGKSIVISCRRTMAKFSNAKRRDGVVFAVPDGADNLTVTGRAICHETGQMRDRLTDRLRGTFGPEYQWATAVLDGEIEAGLDEVGRVIIEILPDRMELIKPTG